MGDNTPEITALEKYQTYKAGFDMALNRAAENFVDIGYRLKVARDTDVLAASGYKTVTEFAQAEYNIDKTQVSRFIHINDRFSEGGYSDRLEEKYRNFGYAKLSIMLQLPDEINEELTPDYSKTEIKAIKDTIDEESKITDIEVMLEQESESTAELDSDLKKVLRKLCEENTELYSKLWEAARQQEWGEKRVQEILAPAGDAIYVVKLDGIGRKQLILKDADNGNYVALFDVRSGTKEPHTWAELLDICLADTAGGISARAAWEELYKKEMPKSAVAPVQPEKAKKESRVTISAPKQKEQKQEETAVIDRTAWESDYKPGDVVIDVMSSTVGMLLSKTAKEPIWQFKPTMPEGSPYNLSENYFKIKPKEEPEAPQTEEIPAAQEDMQLEGQMDISEYDGVVPEATYEEIKEESKDGGNTGNNQDVTDLSDGVGAAGDALQPGADAGASGEPETDAACDPDEGTGVAEGGGCETDHGTVDEPEAIWMEIYKNNSDLTKYLTVWEAQRELMEPEMIGKLYQMAVAMAAGFERLMRRAGNE